MLDCERAGLKEVPDQIPDDVTFINLAINNIKELHSDSFAYCVKVKKLDLSNNKITVIQNNMLRGMPNLEFIILKDNNISYNNLSFPDNNTFDGIRKLKSVSIQYHKHFRNTSLEEFSFMVHKLPQTLEEFNIDLPSRAPCGREFL